MNNGLFEVQVELLTVNEKQILNQEAYWCMFESNNRKTDQETKNSYISEKSNWFKWLEICSPSTFTYPLSWYFDQM